MSPFHSFLRTGSTSRRLALLWSFLFIMLLIAAFPWNLLHAGENLQRFYALCVGFSYPGTGQSLNYTTNDAAMIAEAFKSASGFAPEASRIDLLVDDDATSGDKPTPDDVRKRLQSISREAKEGDRIVFYFSGHGALKEGGYSALVCHGGRNPNDPAGQLLLKDVRDILASSQAESKLVIIDACHSGGKAVGDDGMTPEGMLLGGSRQGKSIEPRDLIIDPKNILPIVRGGSWAADSWECRSAARDWSMLDYPREYTGFRVAMD